MSPSNWKTKLTLLLVSSLTIMSIITISPAIPQMSLEFTDVENADLIVRLVLTIPALFIAIFSALTGRLIDRYGRLKILWFSLVLYTVAGTSGYFLYNLYLILISRAVLGIAVGMSMTIVITLVADYFEGLERQKFVGLQVAFMSLGGILFVGLGGLLADISWRAPFLIYLFALAVLPLSVRYLHEPAPVENKMQKSLVNKAPKIIWLLFINTMLMWIIFFLIPVQIPFHLKDLGIEKNAMVGAAIALSTFFSAVSSFSYARIRSHLNFQSIFSLGYLIMTASYICVVYANSYTMVIIAMMLAGLGMGMMIPNTNIWVMKLAPIEIRGREIGKLTTFWFLGQFLSPIIIYPILVASSLTATFLIAAILLFILAMVWMVIHVVQRRNAVLQSH